jgi:hypothetical protein
MKSIYAASVFLATLWCNSTFASPTNYDSAEDFLLSIPHARSDESSLAEGDLNGDSLKDLVIVAKSEPKEFKRYNQLHVLTQDKSGKFTLAISSKKSQITGMGCCWLDSVKIRNGSIYLQNNAKTSCEIEAATHQFKLYKNTWRLIGLKISNYQHCADPQIMQVRDINILTGKIIDSKQIDDNPAKYEYKVFTPGKILLKNYDFFNGFGAPET